MMGLFSTLLVDGGGRVPRQLRWLGALLRHPLHGLLAHVPWRWSERTVLVLAMQARDNSLRMRWTGRRLRTSPSLPRCWMCASTVANR